MARSGASGEDDQQLVRRVLAGDQDAYQHIVLMYETRLIAYLTYMFGDDDLARDIAQDTFVVAYGALWQWRAAQASTLAPWLYRIATNRALNALRARKARGGTLSSLSSLPERSDAEHSLEDHIALREMLTAALRTLGDEDAACLVLHVVAGERYSEIGARLGLSSEAVRKRVARGVVALRAAYRALDVEARR